MRTLCDPIAVMLALAATLLLGFYVGQKDKPRLVGTGCVASQGPIYANEEDEFPPCVEIKENV